MMDKPGLSVIVVFYNMSREAPRTLYSLSSTYQQHVSEEEYEVVAVDNGSRTPLSEAAIKSFGANITYINITNASPSPSRAINIGVDNAVSSYIGIMVDGARILSPGTIRRALDCAHYFNNPVAQTLGMHLGPDIQTKSIRHGYNTTIEDQLLADIDWKNNGYRLFEIAALAGSSHRGLFLPQHESNLIFVDREHFYRIGGFNEKFETPGGGLVNLDFYNRVTEGSDKKLISLLGEATFHQVHGGIITNQPHDKTKHILQQYQKEYREIYGTPFTPNLAVAELYGNLSTYHTKLLQQSYEAFSEP